VPRGSAELVQGEPRTGPQGKGRERKGREGKGRERKKREGKGREEKGREGKGRERKRKNKRFKRDMTNKTNNATTKTNYLQNK
jgi:hypothetical protein